MARGFYVRNDGALRFADWIADGIKTVETRTRRTLDKLVAASQCDEPVYIIRTESGKPATVIGRCTLIGPYWCGAERFRSEPLRQAHRVPVGSKYDVKDGSGKWLYHIWDVERIEPFELPADAIRHGRVWAEFNLEEA
jgi:hypothetical protein